MHWLLTGSGDMFIDVSDATKPYPENVATHSVVAESDSSDYFREEYIKELKNHISSLQSENKDKQSIIEMFRNGEIIMAPRDK